MNKRGLAKILVFLMMLSLVLAAGPVAMADVNWAEMDDIVISNPAAGAAFYGGDTIDISWELVGISDEANVNLQFSKDGGTTWESIADDVISAVGVNHYSWTAPSLTSENCIIRVSIIIPGFLPGMDAIGYYNDSALFKITKYQIVPGLHPAIPFTPALFYPAAPSELALESAAVHSIHLSWKNNSTNETAIILERKISGGSYGQVKSLDPGTTSYNDTGLNAGTDYWYRVKAINDFGSSSYSDELQASTLSAALPILPLPFNSVEMKFYIGSTDYYLNGALKSMDTPPIIMETRTVLPIRFVADGLGATVQWEPTTRKVTIVGSKTIEMWIDNPVAKVDGVDTFIDPNNTNVKPVIVMPAGRTMIPLRFIAENLGCSVDWNPALSEVLIRYPKIVPL